MPGPWMVFLVLVFALLPAATEVAAVEDDRPVAIRLFGGRMREGMSLDVLHRQLAAEFRSFATSGGDAFMQADIPVHKRMSAAHNRAERGSRIMAMDLDGDGSVTEAEMREKMTYNRNRRVDGKNEDPAIQRRALERWLRLDKDGDGRIGWMEASAPPDLAYPEGRSVAKEEEQAFTRLILVLELDADGDGRLTFPEYTAAGEGIFRSADLDADGILSKEEAQAYFTNVWIGRARPGETGKAPEKR